MILEVPLKGVFLEHSNQLILLSDAAEQDFTASSLSMCLGDTVLVQHYSHDPVLVVAPRTMSNEGHHVFSLAT